MVISDEHTVEFLRGFDGRIHHLEAGYWIKFDIKRTSSSPERPHGLRYAFTLHAPNGKRLLGFDNAHAVPRQRYQRTNVRHDHWHRSGDDAGRPYVFETADRLLADFLSEVERILGQLGLSHAVVDVRERDEGQEP